MVECDFEHVAVVGRVVAAFASRPLVAWSEVFSVVAGQEAPLVDVERVGQIGSGVCDTLMAYGDQVSNGPEAEVYLVAVATTRAASAARWSDGGLAATSKLLACQVEHDGGGVFDGFE